MPLPVITDVFRVALNWGYTTQHAVNVLHFADTTGTQSPANLYADLNTNVTSAMWGATITGAGVVTVEIIPLDGTSPQEDFSTGAPTKWSGAASSSEAIIGAPYIISHKTNTRGPRGRGRTFVPFLAESKQVAGILDSTTANSITTAWATFRAAMATADWGFVIASYAHADANIVQSSVCETVLATQKRRQDRLRV